MAEKNPYNPQTDFTNWQAWEQEQARKQKADFDNSAEGQKAREEGKRKAAIDRAKKEQKAKSEQYTTGGLLGGQGLGIKFDEEGKPKDWKMPDEEKREEIDTKLKEQGFDPLSDKEAETLKKERDKEFYRKEGLVDEQGNIKSGTPVSLSDGEAAGKKAQEGVNRLGDFDMPKGSNNDLSTYELIGDKAKQEGIFPKSIWQAWKKGEFGDPEGKESQQVRNNLILNSAMTAIGNAARGFSAGLSHGTAEHKDSLWKKRQEANMERQTERENQQLDVLKQAETDTQLADMWGSFTPAQKQGLLDAKNAFANGKYADAQDLMRSSMGDEKYSQWLQYFDNLKAQLSVNADARAQEQLRYMEAMGPLGLAVGLLGKFI